MSWHSGDWANFAVTLMSAAAAVAAAIAAFRSGESAKESIKQQRESFEFERKRHILELIKADAEKANLNVQSTKGMDWSFYQAANIAHAIDSARKRISEASTTFPNEEILEMKAFFKEQLNFEITSEMKEGFNMPDALHGSGKSFKESRYIVQMWISNLKFFEFLPNDAAPPKLKIKTTQ